MTLQAELKEKMGFIEKVPACDTCIYCKEFECLMVDGMRTKNCTLNPACTFELSDKLRSTCKHHEPKST